MVIEPYYQNVMLLHSSCHHTSKLGQILHLAAPQYTAYIILEQITILAVCPMLLDLWLSCLSVTLVYSGQMVEWIKMKLGTEVGLSPGHIVLDGDRAPLPQRAQPPFSAHVHCGQTAGWIKVPLGMEVGLAQVALWWRTQLPHKGAQQPPSPLFGPCLLWPNGWMD